MTTPHPAKFTDVILEEINMLVTRQMDNLNFKLPLKVLDPFSGVGTIHKVTRAFTFGNELEWEWASQWRQHVTRSSTFGHAVIGAQVQGNALKLPFRDDSFQMVCTSPAYGNRMADHHNARDGSKRHTYKHYLGRDLHFQNGGGMQWGPVYRVFHAQVWQECDRVLQPGGIVAINISNHIRKGEEQDVVGWHEHTWLNMGYYRMGKIPIATPRQRHGQNGNLRVEHEYLLVFEKPVI